MTSPYPLDPTDILSPPDSIALVESRLTQILTHAYEHAPFQRDRFLAAPTTGFAALVGLPLLHKGDWMPNCPPYGDQALAAPLQSGYAFRTGGTTGQPNFSLFTHSEFQTTIEAFKRVYLAAGLRPNDRVANLFAGGNLYASFLFVNRLLEGLDCLVFPFSQTSDPELVVWHIKAFGINALLGFPTWLLTIAEELARQNIAVQKVFYAGEHLYDADKSHLKSLLRAEVLASAGYAAVDAGLIGYQCPHTTGGHHHVLTGHCHLEILNPETMEACKPGETGLVVVTNLERFLQPVIRYVVGDHARWQAQACPCGRTTPVFELLGRGADSLRIGYAVVSHAEVTQALQDLPFQFTHLQIVKSRLERKDQLILRIESDDPQAVAHDSRVADDIRDAIGRVKPDLKRLSATGYMAPMMVEFVPPGTLDRHPTTGKLIRTRDRTQGLS